MLYINIDLRYLRQLNRICPESIARFFEACDESARKNGGSSVKLPAGFLYQFDTAVVGSIFATARFLGNLGELLEQNRDRIREYFAFVDYTEKPVSPESFLERLSAYDTVVLPDTGIFISQSALVPLGEYVAAEAVPGADMVLFSGLRFPEHKKTGERHSKKGLVPILYSDYSGDPISSLRNLACSLPAMTPSADFTADEAALFSEGGKALDVYARFRFSRRQPEYRISACLDYFGLLFRAFNGTVPNAAKTLRIRVCGSNSLSGAWTPVLERLSECARFGALEASVYPETDLDGLPDDLVDLAWLLYRSLDLLYLDELPDFFRFVGKEADFLKALGGWLHSAGIVSDPANLRSLDPSLESRVAERTEARRARLDLKLASFLWVLYEKGKIEPVFAFYEVLRSLGFEFPDSFLVNCLYHDDNPLGALDSIRSRFIDPSLADTVANLEKARKKYEAGSFDEASLIAKDVLHAFQKGKILMGEYRALSLIALLSLARNSGDDAVVYLEYALENAGQMRDPYCVLATRFEMAMVYFIVGNLHFALCTLDMVESLVEEHYAKDREVLLFFMKGRIAFELGDYRNSEMCFQTAASLASVHQIPESVALCRVWYARSLVHQNRFASAESILAECAPSVPDAWLFLLESALVSGRPIAGVQFPENPMDGDGTVPRWSLEGFTWKSGFSMAEDRCYGMTGEARISARMYQALFLYYKARYQGDSDISAIVVELSRIARTAVDCKDPYGALYYYACYDLGSKSQSVLPADTAGFLSRGFKYMQRRANEIGDNAMREHFMQTPTWNARLYRVARENMLI